jgi:hypothetical protein
MEILDLKYLPPFRILEDDEVYIANKEDKKVAEEVVKEED